jgi:hypothetical protein
VDHDNLDQPEPEALSLAVPFTVCASEGGPFDDAAFVGGFDCGVMHTEMRLLSRIGATPAARWVKPAILDQLDLLAMDSGYTIKRGEADPASGFVWVTFTPDACDCGLHAPPNGSEDA